MLRASFSRFTVLYLFFRDCHSVSVALVIFWPFSAASLASISLAQTSRSHVSWVQVRNCVVRPFRIRFSAPCLTTSVAHTTWLQWVGFIQPASRRSHTAYRNVTKASISVSLKPKDVESILVCSSQSMQVQPVPR